MTWAYESKLTQKQCFNAVMSNYDFMNQMRGIVAASEGYYEKPLASLDLEEQLELIVMMNNSALYNKYKRPELLAEKVEELKQKIESVE